MYNSVADKYYSKPVNIQKPTDHTRAVSVFFLQPSFEILINEDELFWRCRCKEILVYEELSLSEIAFPLNYPKVADIISLQIKKFHQFFYSSSASPVGANSRS